MEQNVLSPVLIDAIGEIMNISLGSSATAVSNMLDHRVDITTPTVSVVNAEDFELGDVDPAIGVEIKYVSGLEGSNVMMLKRSDVKAMVDILLGSETPDEEFQLDELSVSVVCEVMNQMMGSASTALSDFLGRMVNISTPESFELTDLEAFKQEHFPAAHGPIVVVRFQLKIEGILESEFMNVMSVELAKELVAGFGLEIEEEGAADPAPAPAPAAPAPAPAPEPSSGGVMSQEEIERMLAGGVPDAPAAPAPAPAPAGGGGVMSQEEIERMLAGGVPDAPAAPAPAPAPAPAAPAPAAPAATAAPPQMPPMPQMPPAGQMPQYPYPYPPYPYPPYPYPPQPEPKRIDAKPAKMQELSPESKLNEEQRSNLDLIMSVPLEVSVEIGRTRRKVQDILSFSKGSLVVLDKLAGDQVDLFVNGQCVARGDVVVIEDNFGIRITEILQKPDINELTQF